MEQLKLSRINFIDVVTIVVVVLLLSVGAAYYFHKPAPVNTKLDVTVHVGDSVIAKTLITQAQIDKSVFLNSVNVPVNVVGVKAVNDSAGQLIALDIILEGPGYIDGHSNYVFNGQRVLINQKAEITGNYSVIGAITRMQSAN